MNPENILKKHKIRPFAEVNSIPTKKFFDKIKFKFTNYKILLNEEGWLMICLSWDSDWKDNNWRFKYPSDGGWGFGGLEIYAKINFPEVKFRYKWENDDGSYTMNTTEFSIEAGFEFETEGDAYEADGTPKRFRYVYKYSQNTKYGICLYFAPENWGRNFEEVFNYDFENEKEIYL
jgi:hypothetical protein